MSGCTSEDKHIVKTVKKKLLIYCGITMVHPMQKIADIIEKQHNCKITMLQGGSEDIYQSLKMSKKGDLYFPGSDSYRKKHISEGLLSDCIYVGYNQMALLVVKGNPKGIKADLNCLINPAYSISIGNPDSSSVGKVAKKILTKEGLYNKVLLNAFKVSSDSRTMNNLLKDGSADIIFNWRATAYFKENKDKMDALSLDASVAPKKKLLINLTTCCKHEDIARAFMLYAGSEKGQQIFYEYGFLDKVGQARTIEHE
jgi:molybdate transport system substrate-binding protein